MAGFTLKLINKGLAERYKRMASKLPQVVDETMRELANEAKVDFQKTTRTWETQVGFSVRRITKSSYQVFVDQRTRSGKIYKYVDLGTRAHDITAKKASMLMFPSNFTPKTSPGVIGSGAGSSGGGIISKHTVHHPGTKARKFTETIHRKYGSRMIAARMRIRLNQGIQAVGL